ncbi:MAG: glycoside hydrolase family 13 protein [Bacteroidota bacterium]
MSVPDWVQDAIFYQIFPDRFARSERLAKNGLEYEPWDSPPTVYGYKGGDLYGVAEHLDYLQDLGITAIYLNPIFASACNHRYHTYDFYQVDPLLGGNEALRLLTDEMHKRAMRIVLDGVFNHASRGFWQFHHVLESAGASPYRDWFYFDADRLSGRKHWGAYPTPHEYQEIHREGSLKAIGYQGWWDLPALPKFKVETPAVREFLFGVAEHWIRFGIDGWRLDVPGEINDDSFWQEFQRRVRSINSEAYIVGEIWHEAGRWLQGDQFDASMNYLLTAACMSYFGAPHLDMDVIGLAGGLQGRVRPMDAQSFAGEVDRLFHLYRPEFTYAELNLLDSHDMARFVTCAGEDKTSLKLAMLFTHTYPGAPCTYYGDEIGLNGRHDPDCRKSFPWDESRWDKDLLAHTKACMRLRKDYVALRRGSFQRLAAEGHSYAFGRRLEEERLVVAFNAGQNMEAVDIPLSDFGGRDYAVIFGAAEVEANDDRLWLTLRPRSGAVLKSAA